MIREVLREALAHPLEAMAAFLTLLLVYGAILAVLFAGAAPVARP